MFSTRNIGTLDLIAEHFNESLHKPCVSRIESKRGEFMENVACLRERAIVSILMLPTPRQRHSHRHLVIFLVSFEMDTSK